MPQIKIKRGVQSSSSNPTLDDGELYLANGGGGEGKLYAGTSDGDTNTDKVRVKYADNASFAKKIGTETSPSTIGSDTDDGITPVYVKEGSITAASHTIGSDTHPVYVYSGEITESGGEVGDTHTPMYLKDGNMTACSGVYASYALKIGSSESVHPQIGNSQRPIYISDSGVPTPINAKGISVTISNGVASFSATTANEASGLYAIKTDKGSCLAYISHDSAFDKIDIPLHLHSDINNYYTLYIVRSTATVTLTLYNKNGGPTDISSCVIRKLFGWV